MPRVNEPVARVSDLEPGSMKRVRAGSSDVLLCATDGRIFAVEDVCTHDGGDLYGGSIHDCRVECPRHGAEFDLETGAALTLPAIVPIRTFPVRIEGDDVFIDISASE